MLCTWGAIRAGAFAPPCRYLVVSEGGTPVGTVHDIVTGLTWQRTVSPVQYTWADAQSACAGLNYAGYSSGWRTPTVKELQSIVDYTRQRPSIDIFAFPFTPIEMFWTSNSTGGNRTLAFAWFVDFSNGAVNAYSPSNTFYVRCVR